MSKVRERKCDALPARWENFQHLGVATQPWKFYINRQILKFLKQNTYKLLQIKSFGNKNQIIASINKQTTTCIKSMSQKLINYKTRKIFSIYTLITNLQWELFLTISHDSDQICRTRMAFLLVGQAASLPLWGRWVSDQS